MALFSLETPGLSLWSIPAAYVIAFYPMNAKFRLIGRTTGYDNVEPRSNLERFSKKVPAETAALARRYEGAHQNGFEILPIWIGAVLAANFANLETTTVNTVSAGFLAIRLLYNYVYINQKTEGAAAVRSLLFFTGLAAPMYLLIKAGNTLRLQGTVA